MQRDLHRLKMLQKRADWLAKRIAEASSHGKDLSFDRSELDALLWAIEQLAPSGTPTSEVECA